MTEYPPLLNESKVLDFEAIMPIYVWFNYVSILWGNVEGQTGTVFKSCSVPNTI